VGVCGAGREFPISTALLAHKITDGATGRTFFSDILLEHSFKEAAVTTEESPVLHGGKEVVEMEASGFAQAASLFLPAHRWFAIKVVSDHRDQSILEPPFVRELIRAAVPEIAAFAAALCETVTPVRPPLSGTEQVLLEKVGANLRLTQSQQSSLKSAAQSYKVGLGGDLNRLEAFADRPVKTKEEGKRTLEEIQKLLAPPEPDWGEK